MEFVLGDNIQKVSFALERDLFPGIIHHDATFATSSSTIFNPIPVRNQVLDWVQSPILESTGREIRFKC